jgi:hypothetical protein
MKVQNFGYGVYIGGIIYYNVYSIYFNGKKVHVNWPIQQVWGGPNSGIDGGNDSGKGITDVPGGLKLQAEGHDVLYKNIWIERMDIKKPNTDF